MRETSCPSCGESDQLRGERDGDSIHVACGRCAHEWDRDLSVRCRSCGSDRVVYAPKPLWEKGRGVQRSPVGRFDAYHCAACGDSDAMGSLDT